MLCYTFLFQVGFLVLKYWQTSVVSDVDAHTPLLEQDLLGLNNDWHKYISEMNVRSFGGTILYGLSFSFCWKSDGNDIQLDFIPGEDILLI